LGLGGVPTAGSKTSSEPIESSLICSRVPSIVFGAGDIGIPGAAVIVMVGGERALQERSLSRICIRMMR
jgi:hypothetical protein